MGFPDTELLVLAVIAIAGLTTMYLLVRRSLKSDRPPHVLPSTHAARRISPNHPAGSALPGLRGPASGSSETTTRLHAVRPRAYTPAAIPAQRPATEPRHALRDQAAR